MNLSPTITAVSNLLAGLLPGSLWCPRSTIGTPHRVRIFESGLKHVQDVQEAHSGHPEAHPVFPVTQTHLPGPVSREDQACVHLPRSAVCECLFGHALGDVGVLLGERFGIRGQRARPTRDSGQPALKRHVITCSMSSGVVSGNG